MARESEEFTWTNADQQDGFAELSWGTWGWTFEETDVAPVMLSFEEAAWMGKDDAKRFSVWLAGLLARDDVHDMPE